MIAEIKKLAQKYFPEVVEIRRHLHAHPELSFEEVETAKYICKILQSKGITYRSGVAGNGIVVEILCTNSDAEFIALRADIDALPIQETNNVDYASTVSGKMHACGHDVHTSSMLGTAFILNDLKDRLDYNYRILFQPAEEKLPGGASLMIKEGVLKNPEPLSIYGQHVHPPLSVGKVGFRSGLYMASADELFVSVRGDGGHAALPQGNIDPIFIAASIVLNLQQIVSRRSDPTIPTVLSFGKINSIGGATNIIPDEVKLEGTFRTMDEKWRKKAHGLMKTIAEDTAKAMGGECEFNIVNGYPCLINNENSTKLAREAAVEYLGKENVVELPIRLTSEDFAFYSQEIPSCFYRLGTGNEAKGIVSSVHTSTFNVDEDCLELSIGLMAYIAIQKK